MAETSLTKVTAAAYGAGVNDAAFEAVDQPNGNTFANTGETWVTIKNGSGGNLTITFTTAVSKYSVNAAQSVSPAVVTNGNEWQGQLPLHIFGANPVINYSTGASVTIAVVEPAKTPL